MSELTTTVISASRNERFRQYFLDLWDFRDLFVSFLERDVKVRYKQTILGILWVVIQPLITAGAFALIFGRIAGMPVGSMPYTLFYLAALVPWVTFSQALTGSAASLEGNAGLISKIYFPRLIVPLAPVVGTLPDFAIGFVLMNMVAAVLGYWSVLLLVVAPFLLLLQTAAATGMGLFLTALNAQYRDVRYVIPFLVQIGMLATPVIYPLERLPAWAQGVQMLNPMATVVSGYRWSLGGPAVPISLVLGNITAALFLLTVGILFFRWRERKLVDLL